jgi:hypothetical protein
MTNQNNPLSGSFFGDEGSGITQAGAGKYPNPFCDIASEYVPRDINWVLEWCEYLYMTMGTYRAAARRVVRYFLTEMQLEGESDSEREEYEDFLNKDLKIMQVMADVGDEYMVYGNVFLSVFFPFDRYLICPKCGTAYRSTKIDYKFNKKDGTFSGHCGKCNIDTPYTREDRRSPDLSRVRVIRWNPKQIKMRVHPISGTIEYYLEMDAQFVKHIEDGDAFYLDETPWSMLQCIIKKGKKGERPLYKFNEDAIYHLRDSTLSGLPIKGWAIPPIMPNFKLAYYIQLLRRYDEAIALDFIIPFRVIYPDNQGPVGQDVLSQMSMGNFVSKIQHLVQSKRKNMTDLQVSPVKIGYEMLGGEAQQLAPKDSIAQALDELLNAVGFPAELYKGSLSIQAFPVALRLFEKSWGALVDGMNDFVRWLLTRLSRHFMWGDITGELRSVTLADDIERKALALQAAAGMDISKATAYRPLGIDYEEEQKRVIEEQELIQSLQQEAEERAQAAQMGMADQSQDPNAQGGAPGGQPGATPGDVYEQGKQLAEQLLLQTPATMRRGELVKIKHSNPTLHAIVMQEMDNMRSEMARQGQAMMMEQAKQASAEIPALAHELPSPFYVGLLIADQIGEYNRNDLRKMAMDIKHEVKGAKAAFHFVFEHVSGAWTG